MGILDRLKPQPRWKHSDPAVRLRAIPELGDPIELAALAEHDPDAEVRKAAIAKVDDPVVLGRVTTSDTDPGVQDAAADRLLGLALDAIEFGSRDSRRPVVGRPARVLDREEHGGRCRS